MRRVAVFWVCVATMALGSASARASEYTIETDRIYGHKAGMALTLDIVRPSDGGNGIGLIDIVSDGFRSYYFDLEQAMTTSTRSRGRLSTLVGKGYTLFIVRHGSSPYFTAPDAVADLRKSVAYIGANAKEFEIDPDRLGAFGASAGGYLALMLATTAHDDAPSTSVAAAVAYYPPVDLTGLAGPTSSYPALNFDSDLVESLSPILQVSPDDAPTLLIHGDEDTTVPLSHSERMHKALEDAKVPTELIVVEGAGHAFRGAHGHRAATALAAWFDRYLVNAD